MKILDVNVLLYAYNSSAPHHAPAREFLESALSGDETVGLAWVVITGFIRISTHPAAMAQPLTVDQACEVIDELLEIPSVRIVQPSPDHWHQLRGALIEHGSAGNLTTDAHLAALAIENGATLISYDTDFARFEHMRWFRPQ